MNTPFACDNAPGSASSFPHCHLFTFRCHSPFALLLLGEKVTQISKCFFTSCNLGWAFMWLNFSQDPESPPVFWIHQVEPCLTLFFPLSHLSSSLAYSTRTLARPVKQQGLLCTSQPHVRDGESDFLALSAQTVCQSMEIAGGSDSLAASARKDDGVVV